MAPKMKEVNAPIQIIFSFVGSLLGGVLPDISHMGMCHPEGYGFYTFSGVSLKQRPLKPLRPPTK